MVKNRYPKKRSPPPRTKSGGPFGGSNAPFLSTLAVVPGVACHPRRDLDRRQSYSLVGRAIRQSSVRRFEWRRVRLCGTYGWGWVGGQSWGWGGGHPEGYHVTYPGATLERTNTKLGFSTGFSVFRSPDPSKPRWVCQRGLLDTISSPVLAAGHLPPDLDSRLPCEHGTYIGG